MCFDDEDAIRAENPLELGVDLPTIVCGGLAQGNEGEMWFGFTVSAEKIFTCGGVKDNFDAGQRCFGQVFSLCRCRSYKYIQPLTNVQGLEYNCFMAEITAEKKGKWLKELSELLAISSLSADEEYAPQMEEAALWLINKLKGMGFEAKVMENERPVVYAERLDAGDLSPTVLIYGHYDVQSPEPLGEWSSEPFKPEIRAGNIYGRGTADDKGQLYTWIAAVEALLEKKGRLPVNIKFLIEGAEEIGSKGLSEFVADNKTLLKSDICVLSDNHSLSENQPVITYGLRGLAYMEVHVKTLSFDVHSGTYGGNVLNAANVLAEIIAKLKDKDGRILVSGFYDEVREVSVQERKQLEKFPFTEKEVMSETGATIAVGEEGMSVQMRAGARPTLDVNGIWSGYTGVGPKTAIPAEAHAKISMRLVPNQTSKDIAEKFTGYIKSLTPEGATIEVISLHGAEPLLLNKDSRYFKAAEEAFEKVFGNKPLYELAGGSIGITVDFKKILGIDSVMMGYGLPDDGLHSPNEKLSLSMWEKGIRTNIEFLERLH